MARVILIVIACIAGIIGGGVKLFQSLPMHQPDGIVAPATPIQEAIPNQIEPFEFGGFTLKPLAEFFVQARILSKCEYHDESSSISPYDLALGWGPMSDQTILSKLKISQSFRFYFYEYQYPEPAPPKVIASSSCNMHLIPSTDEIRSKIAWSRKGEVVEFSGYLVNVSRPDGFRWNSSTSRDDTGKGACEIVYVTAYSRQQDDK